MQKLTRGNWLAIIGSLIVLNLLVAAGLAWLIRGSPPSAASAEREPSATLTPLPDASPSPLPLPIASTTQTRPATSRPTASPEPLAAIPSPTLRVGITADTLRVRGGPGLTFEILDRIDQTIHISVVGRSEDASWIEVQLPDGIRGWVAAEYLSLPLAPELLPIATGIIPTPTQTHTPTASATASHTATSTRTSSPTRTPTATATETSTATHTHTATSTPTASHTPTATYTPTEMPALPTPSWAWANPHGAGRVQVRWAPVEGATGYTLYSDLGTGRSPFARLADLTNTTYIDDDVLPATYYRYAIIAHADDHRPATRYVGTQTTTEEFGGTPAPASSPTPGATDDQVTLGIVGSSDYLDELGNLVIVGEIRNDESWPVTNIEITGAFYDHEETLIDRVTVAPMLRVVLPGQKAPFAIPIPLPYDIQGVSLRAAGVPAAVEPVSGALELVEHEDSLDSDGLYHVAGVIRNQSRTAIDRVRAIVTLYTDDRLILDASICYSRPLRLTANGRGDFDCTFPDHGQAESYIVLLEGD